ncbi:MAG TPA: PAS domain S-box protein, partial [Candidatus Binatia bacterium]|nr:PAS domain S-box protein [Candidatus Binatia bacterium]
MPTDLPETIQHRLALALRELRSHAVALLDSDGRVDAWLAGAERIFGYRADEIVGRNISVLFVAEDLARGADVWERDTATHAGDSEDDRWHQRKDGGRIWVSGTLTALRDAEGQPAGFVKIMRARTDQKLQVEAAAGRVAALEHAETRRVHFVSTLAHELRNPLAAIESGTSLIDGVANVAPEVRFAASVVRRQVDFMSRV